MLIKCKMYVRKFKKDVLDEEIQDLIDSAKADLKLSGVINQDETDPLIIRAITCYCKANFGYENKEAERFDKSYEMLKQHLSLCEEYTKPKVVSDNG
ncbi:DNA-packaging protein [Sporanaerobium hydrogeniformans]|uniref:DNA-packaging protein n=1 Tax=Sporanaerobium hydrogeniformans TaxID=3072179 RepID=A0AC61DB43_9FIRM|nr:DNA-packaging protein [Sporanaerobium hydrogeniformans]